MSGTWDTLPRLRSTQEPGCQEGEAPEAGRERPEPFPGEDRGRGTNAACVPSPTTGSRLLAAACGPLGQEGGPACPRGPDKSPASGSFTASPGRTHSPVSSGLNLRHPGPRRLHFPPASSWGEGSRVRSGGRWGPAGAPVLGDRAVPRRLPAAGPALPSPIVLHTLSASTSGRSLAT